MQTCKTCKYWQLSHPDFIDKDWNHYELLGAYQITPDSQGRTLRRKSEQQAINDTGYAARWCTKVTNSNLSASRPKRNGVSLFGEYDDGAAMATGEDFGCILHELIAE